MLYAKCTEQLKLNSSKISLRVTFKMNGHLNGCTEKQVKNGDNWSSTSNVQTYVKVIINILISKYQLFQFDESYQNKMYFILNSVGREPVSITRSSELVKPVYRDY